jgi:hypothetical protein
LCFFGNCRVEEKETPKRKRQKTTQEYLNNPNYLTLPLFPAPKWLNQRFKLVVSQLTSATRKGTPSTSNQAMKESI